MLHNSRDVWLQKVSVLGNSVIMCHYPMILSGCKIPWS